MKDASGNGENSGSPVAGDQGVYGISVAAELVGSTPQSLRLYEARGLLVPARSDGGTRRYSNDDLTRLRAIATLLDEGLNLAGVAAVLTLQAVNRDLQTRLDDAMDRAATERGTATPPDDHPSDR